MTMCFTQIPSFHQCDWGKSSLQPTVHSVTGLSLEKTKDCIG